MVARLVTSKLSASGRVVCAIAIAGLVVASGCRERDVERVVAATSRVAWPLTTNITTGCLERFDDATDYFPDKATVEEAVNFSVEYHRSYKVVTVKQTYLGGPAERYVLLQCGAPPPQSSAPLSRVSIVTVPVKTMFSASTTHVPLLVDLDRLDTLTGVSRFDSIVSPPVVDRIKAGSLVEFAPKGVIDAERVVAQHPSVLMTGGSDSSTFLAIRAAGACPWLPTRNGSSRRAWAAPNGSSTWLCT